MGYDFFARHDNGQSSCPASILIGRERDSRPQLFPSRKILKSSPSLGNCARDYPSTPPPEIRFPPEKRVVNQKERKNVEKNSVLVPRMGVVAHYLVWEGKSISFRSQRCFYSRLMVGLFFPLTRAATNATLL